MQLIVELDDNLVNEFLLGYLRDHPKTESGLTDLQWVKRDVKQRLRERYAKGKSLLKQDEVVALIAVQQPINVNETIFQE